MNRTRFAPCNLLLIAAVAAAGMGGAHASASQWTGAASTNWSNPLNWSAGVPGAISGDTNLDLAIFGANPANAVPIVDVGRNLQSISFDNTSGTLGALTLGSTVGNALLLTSGGSIAVSANVVTAQIVNAPLILAGDPGVYSVINNSTTTSATLTFGGSIQGSATGSNVTNLTLSGSNTGANVITGPISNGTAGGKLSLNKAGPGTWTLTNTNNSYSGGTILSGGTLKFSPSTLGTGPLTFAGGMLFFVTGNTQDVSTTLGMVNSTGPISADVNGNAVTFAAALAVSNTGGLTVNDTTGTGSLTLTNNGSTHSGATTINTNATLRISGEGTTAGGQLGKVPNATTPGYLTINGGTLSITSSLTLDSARGIAVSNAAKINVASGQTLTYFGVIANGSATGSLTLSGTGTTVLNGENAYTLGTIISAAGTVVLGNNAALGTGALTISTAGTTLQANTPVVAANTITANANFTVGGGSNVANGMTFGQVTLGATRIITNNNTTGVVTLGRITGNTFGVTFSGNGSTVIAGPVSTTTGALTKNGTGTLTINGSAALAEWTGTTTINAGTLVLNGGNANTFGSTTWSVVAGATLRYNMADPIANNAVLTVNGTLDFNGFHDTIGAFAGGATGGTGSIILSGATTVTLSAGDTNVYSGVISGTGTGGITLTGGTPRFSGNNTYTGPTTITGGTLCAGIASNPGVSGSFGLNSAVTLANTSGVTLDLSGFNTQIGSLTGGGTAGGNVTLGSGALTVGGDNTSPAPYSGVISGTGSLVKIGTGTWIPTGTSTYTGTTLVAGGNVMVMGNAPSGSAGIFGNATSAITLGNATTSANNLSVSLLMDGPFTIARSILVANQPTAGAYTLGATTQSSSTFSGAISVHTHLTFTQAFNTGTNALTIQGGISAASGTPTITFAGPGNMLVKTVGITNNLGTIAVNIIGGTTTFTAANTYTGPTTISSGSLLLTGSGSLGNTAISTTGTGNFAVMPGSGATTAGTNGTPGVGASLSLGTGTLFSMVDGAAGTFNLQQGGGFGTALTINGAMLEFDLGNTGADSLALSSTSTASVSGTNTIGIALAGTNLANGTYTLISAPGGGLSGNFLFDNATTSKTLVVNSYRYILTLGNTNTAETLTVTAVQLPTWIGTIDDAWSNGANWANNGGLPPGSTSSTTSTDTAVFNGGGNGNITITINSATQNIHSIAFDTVDTDAYTIGSAGPGGGNPLLLTNGGAIWINAEVLSSQVIHAPLILQGNNVAYAFVNNALSTAITLNVGGGVSGGAPGTTVLTLRGGNIGANTISGLISDGAATQTTLIKTDAGTWSLTNTGNTYSGGTNITNGRLRFSNGALGTAGTIMFTGGILQFAAGNTQDISTRIDSLVMVQLNTNGNNVVFNGTLPATNFFGIAITDSTGTGSLMLANNGNLYTGTTMISAGGTLIISAEGNAAGAQLGKIPAVPTPGSIVITGGKLMFSNTMLLNSARGIAVGGLGTATIHVAAGQSVTYGGAIANNGSGTGGLTVTGTGTLILSGINTHTGGTTITSGATLQVGNQLTVDAVLPGIITNNGKLVIAHGNSGVNQTFGATITGAGVVEIAGAVGGVDVANRISFSTPNSYTGGTLFTSGTAQYQSGVDTAFGAAPVTPTVNLTFNGGGIMSLNNTGPTTFGPTRTVLINAGGAFFRGGYNNTTNIQGQLTGTGSFNVVWDGGPTVLANNTANPNNYQGDTNIGVPGPDYFSTGTALLRMGGPNNLPYFGNAGNSSPSNVVFGVNPSNPGNAATLDLNANNTRINGLTGGANAIVDSTSGNPTLTVGDNNATSTFSGLIRNTSGTLSLTKIGAGTLTLAGTAANTNTGLTTISAGELDLNKTTGNAIGGSLTVNGGAAKWLGNDQVANTATVTVLSGVLNLGNRNETVANLTISGGSSLFGTGIVAATGTTSLSGGSNTFSGTTTFVLTNISGGANVVTGASTGGAGTLTTTGTLNFTGAASPNITLNSDAVSAATLALAGNVVVDATVTTGTANITSSGAEAIPGRLNLGSATRTFTVNATVPVGLNITAQITNGGLTKAGVGTLQLANANTYSGGTTLSAGRLLITNTAGSATGTGTVSMSSGTLASGSLGSISGALTSTGGTIAPGDVGSIGTLTLGSTLSLTAASTLNFDINGAAKDLLSITGVLTVTGTPTVTLATSGTLASNYTLATFAASGLTNASFALPSAPVGYNWDVQTDYIRLISTGSLVSTGSGTWKNGSTNGLWDTSTSSDNNWASSFPNAVGNVATFADPAAGGTTPGTVDLVTPKTIGGVVLNSTTTGYTLGVGASPALSLQVDNGKASITISGTVAHTIAAKVVILSPTTISAASGASVSLTGGLENAASTVTIGGAGAVHTASIKNTGTVSFADTGAHTVGEIIGASSTLSDIASTLASAGTTTLTGDVQITATRVWQHTLNLGDGASINGAKLTIAESVPTYVDDSLAPAGNSAFVSVVKNLNIFNSGGFKGTLDLTNNDLVIDYTGGASPLTTIETLVAAGYNGGDWLGAGITSSTAAANPNRFALVVVDNMTNATHQSGFDGVNTSSHAQVIVKFSWVADLDLDGFVTTNDAVTFAAHYAPGNPANHQTGDLNYNGIYDSNDAILFAAAYSTSLPSLPEPASLGVLAIGAGAMLMRRRKHFFRHS